MAYKAHRGKDRRMFRRTAIKTRKENVGLGAVPRGGIRK